MKIALYILFIFSNASAVVINTKSLTGFSPARESRFKNIISVTEKIILSPEFKLMILGWYHNKKPHFFDTTDSNLMVYGKVTSKDWLLEYRLEYIYKKPFSPVTIGYTMKNVSWIVINSKIFDSLKDSKISANICHEYAGHKLGGYEHSIRHDGNRPYSVPYGVGYICGVLYEKNAK